MNGRLYTKEVFLRAIEDLNSKVKREIRISKLKKILKINK